MSKKGRPRQPRYVLSTTIDGKTMFVSDVTTSKRGPYTVAVTMHTPHVGMAKFYTKYKADSLRQDLSTKDCQYQVEPLHLNQ